jgi:hypothetical protein
VNPGPSEEIGKVAGGIVDALKNQPALLVMFIINAAMLALLWRVAEGSSTTREREVKLLYENQAKVSEILSHCIIPGKEYKLQSDETKPFIMPDRPIPPGIGPPDTPDTIQRALEKLNKGKEKAPDP